MSLGRTFGSSVSKVPTVEAAVLSSEPLSFFFGKRGPGLGIARAGVDCQSVGRGRRFGWSRSGSRSRRYRLSSWRCAGRARLVLEAGFSSFDFLDILVIELALAS